MVRDPLDDCAGFDWDEGNIDKNWYSAPGGMVGV